MSQTTDQIETHIENQREALGSNLQELETKFSSITNWKHHFQKHPMAMIGVAFGGGVLLATMLGSRKSWDQVANPGAATNFAPATSHFKDAALETWGLVKSAVMGVAAARIKDYVEEIIPGFREQFDRAAKQ
jgi:hypothetical protein